MKVWMSPQTTEKNHYVLHAVGRIIIIVGLALVLTAGIAILTIHTKEHQVPVSLITLLAVVGIIVWLAIRTGQQSLQDALLFCLDENYRLYVIDVRQTVRYQRGLFGYTNMALRIQRNLEAYKQQMEQLNTPPPNAVEILHVNSIRENGTYYGVSCWVQYGNKRKGKHTYLLVKGYENEDELLRILEQKQSWENSVEIKENKGPFFIFLSAVAFVVCAVICALSHPGIGKLPEVLYFPLLGFSTVPFVCMVYFIVKYHRGE